MTDTIIPVRSEYEKLLEEVRKLRARVIELTALRDDLLYHICPALQAKYDEKIGSVERELLAAQMYLKEKQRIIEILQAQLNRQEKPSMKEAEKKAHEEFRAYEEELKRKAEEARRFREHWENETQWSKHEQAARDRKGKRSTGGPEPDGSGELRSDGREPDESGRSRSDGPEPDGSGGPKEPKADGPGPDGTGEQPGGAKNAGPDRGNGDSEGSEDFDIDEGVPEDEDPIHELKRLYRQIVKRLHPDVHPDPTDREKDLLNRANKAYKEGDLEAMRRIWEELAGTEQAEESFEDTEEGRAKLRELVKLLRKRCAVLEEEIRQIRISFPYKFKALLDDDRALEKTRQELLAQLEEVRALFVQVDEYISGLKRRMNEQKQGR